MIVMGQAPHLSGFKFQHMTPKMSHAEASPLCFADEEMPRLPGEEKSCYNEIMNVMTEIEQRVLEVRDEMIRLRRDFHRHPELGFHENRTARIIAGYLRDLGLEVREGVGKTGVVGVLRGAAPGRTLMLRADMDALPIQERSQTPYRSTNPGVMHACGHDGHMAILLGAARVLAGMKGRLRGQVIVFQPAEEGAGGAREMIEDSSENQALRLRPPSHHPPADTGPGRLIMAAMDSFVLKVTGRSVSIHPCPRRCDAISKRPYHKRTT